MWTTISEEVLDKFLSIRRDSFSQRNHRQSSVHWTTISIVFLHGTNTDEAISPGHGYLSEKGPFSLRARGFVCVAKTQGMDE